MSGKVVYDFPSGENLRGFFKRLKAYTYPNLTTVNCYIFT